MSLLHPGLLIGLAFAAIPVALHLLLRARPRKLIFPALRLLQQRRMQNQRRMRLRHLWLLLLRIGLIVLLVLVVARPSLPAANYQPTLMETSSLILIAGAIGFGYFVTMRLWRMQRISTPTLLTRRSMLRGGLGFTGLLLALLLVGWPYQRRIAAELTSPRPHAVDNLPVAAVFVCDSSQSMTYQHEGRSRLEASKEVAVRHLQHLPAGSVAAVLELAGDLPVALSPDLTAVQNRLESLTTQTLTHEMNDALQAAIRLQQDDRARLQRESGNSAADWNQDRYVREVYLLTDLAKSAWRNDSSSQLATQLSELQWLGIYVIDVGVETPVNIGLLPPTLSRQSVSAGGTAFVETTVTRTGTPMESAVVELWQAADGGPLAKRDQQTVTFNGAIPQPVRFSLEQLTGRLLQGEIRLVTSDPFPIDDSISFSVGVLPPLEILVVAPDRSTAAFWLEALRGLSELGSAYQTQFVRPNEWTELDLQKFDVVCLLNLPQPGAEDWDRLQTFVNAGGGLFVSLGATSRAVSPNPATIDPLSYATEAAQRLLPAVPKASLQFSPPAQLQFRNTNSPLAARLEAFGVLNELAGVDFRRYWSVEIVPDAITLADWTGDVARPAFLLREVENGRCLLFTSSLDSTAWSDWPRNWTYLAVADQCLQLLSRQATRQFNHLVGDPVAMPMPRDTPSLELLLRQPDLTQRRVAYDRATQELVIGDAHAAGNYQLLSAATPPQLLTGWSLNPPSQESDFARLATADLDELFGKDRYSVARDPDELTKSVLAGRFGQEVSGLLLGFLIVIFLTEQVTATWFYRQDEAVA